MFSVLMSLYKKENPEYLKACLESLVEQTLLADEVVIVFDGPVGHDLEGIVAEFSDALKIRILKLEKNMGLGIALQEGMKNCSYDIILRMDTDDICHRERFEKQINFLNYHPEVVLVGSDIIEFDCEGNERIKSLPEKYEDIKSYSRWKNPINHMAAAFRKDEIQSVGGYKHHLFMEDYNLWLRLISSGFIIGNIPEVLVYARVGQHMVKKRRGWNYIKSEFELAKVKNNLSITSPGEGWFIFVIRSLMRVIPVGMLSILYNKDRKLVR